MAISAPSTNGENLVSDETKKAAILRELAHQPPLTAQEVADRVARRSPDKRCDVGYVHQIAREKDHTFPQSRSGTAGSQATVDPRQALDAAKRVGTSAPPQEQPQTIPGFFGIDPDEADEMTLLLWVNRSTARLAYLIEAAKANQPADAPPDSEIGEAISRASRRLDSINTVMDVFYGKMSEHVPAGVNIQDALRAIAVKSSTDGNHSPAEATAEALDNLPTNDEEMADALLDTTHETAVAVETLVNFMAAVS